MSSLEDLLLSFFCSFLIPRRNLDYFQHCHFSAMSAVDPDNGNGEITVRLPPEMYLNIAGNI